MNSENLSDKEKTILQGRIYPAIQACVSNRYKIILGLFVYYGFVLNTEVVLESPIRNGISCFVSVIFTGFVIHNLGNYWLNLRERETYEHEEKHTLPTLEFIFAGIALILIWGPLFFLLVSFSDQFSLNTQTNPLMHIIKWMQIASVILALAGTYMLAFGLRVREGISKEIWNQIKTEAERIGAYQPSDVWQRKNLIYAGLALITIAAILQSWLILAF